MQTLASTPKTSTDTLGIINWEKLTTQLNQSKMFRYFGFTPEQIQALCEDRESGISIKYVPNNYTLITEWPSDNRDMFMIIDGRAQISIGGDVITTIEEPTDLFWENGYLRPETGRIATVKTHHDDPDTIHVIMHIESHFIEQHLMKNPENHCRFLKNLGWAMTQKLIQMNILLSEMQKDNRCKNHIDVILDMFQRKANTKRFISTIEDNTKPRAYEWLRRNCVLFRAIPDEETVKKFVYGTIEPDIPETAHPRTQILKKWDEVFHQSVRDEMSCGIILTGDFEIKYTGDDGNPGIVRRLWGGDLVGEVAFLNPEIRRTASVIVKSEKARVIFFTRAYLDSMKNLEFLATLHQWLAESIADKIELMNQMWKMLMTISPRPTTCGQARDDFSDKIQTILL